MSLFLIVLTIIFWFLFYFYYQFLIFFHIKIFFVFILFILFFIFYTKINVLSLVFWKYIFLCFFWNFCFFLSYHYWNELAALTVKFFMGVNQLLINLSFNTWDTLKAGLFFSTVNTSNWIKNFKIYLINLFLLLCLLFLNLFFTVPFILPIFFWLGFLSYFFSFFQAQPLNFLGFSINLYCAFYTLYNILYILHTFYPLFLIDVLISSNIYFYFTGLINSIQLTCFWLYNNIKMIRLHFIFFFYYDYTWWNTYYIFRGVDKPNYIYLLLKYTIKYFIVFLNSFFWYINKITLFMFLPSWYYELWYSSESTFVFYYFFINISLFCFMLLNSVVHLSDFFVYYVTVDFDLIFFVFHITMQLSNYLISALINIFHLFEYIRIYFYPFLTYFLFTIDNKTSKNEDN